MPRWTTFGGCSGSACGICDAGWPSQEETAHRARLHVTYLSDLERGMQTPTLDVVNRLATALRVTLADLFHPLDKRFRNRSRKPRGNGEPGTRVAAAFREILVASAIFKKRKQEQRAKW